MAAEMIGVELKCYHDDCGHEWTYKGKSRIYATCPQCQRKVRIDKARRS